MNSSFPNRWSFSYLKFTKYVANIIAEPKYKYAQQEQVTVRNHNRSTALERPVKILGGLNRFYGYLTSPSASIMAQIKLFILVGLGRSFFVCCLAHRGSTVGFLLLQCSSGVVRHPRDLQVSVATRFCRVLIFASS